MPVDDRVGQSPGTVWAGNLSLNWGKKMHDIFPEYAADELAAAMFYKLTRATGTTADGRPIDARYAWMQGRAKGVKTYIEDAMRVFKEGTPVIYRPPADAMKVIPSPETQKVVLPQPAAGIAV